MADKSNKALANVQTTASLVDWSDPKMQSQIRETYGKNLNDMEWKMFMGLGMATKLNPFLREIWCLKYGTGAAVVFVGRDGYRRSAQAHPEYEYHYSMAVYSNDKFNIKSGVVEHEFSAGDRGTLMGAYCVVKRKSASKEAVTYIDVKEYKQTGGVWATKPATMACKVSEAQGLRGSFQELFAGTYEESEKWEAANADDVVDTTPPALKPLEGQTSITDPVSPAAAPAPAARRGRPSKVPAEAPPAPTAPQNVVDAQVVDTPPAPQEQGKVADLFRKTAPAPVAPPVPAVPEDAIPVGKIRADQTKKLFAVWGEYKKVAGLTDDDSNVQRKALMREMFFVDSSVQMNERQADELIERIESMTELAREYKAGENGARNAGDSF